MSPIQRVKLSVPGVAVAHIVAIINHKWRAGGHCDVCGIGRGSKWRGERVRLETTSVNGDFFDFRQVNLAQLCQYCAREARREVLRRLPDHAH